MLTTYGNKVHVQVQSSSSSSSSTVKGEKFSRITWSSKNLSFRTGIKVFEMHKMRRSHVTECASLCERNGYTIVNCLLLTKVPSATCSNLISQLPGLILDSPMQKCLCAKVRCITDLSI